MRGGVALQQDAVIAARFAFGDRCRWWMRMVQASLFCVALAWLTSVLFSRS